MSTEVIANQAIDFRIPLEHFPRHLVARTATRYGDFSQILSELLNSPPPLLLGPLARHLHPLARFFGWSEKYLDITGDDGMKRAENSLVDQLQHAVESARIQLSIERDEVVVDVAHQFSALVRVESRLVDCRHQSPNLRFDLIRFTTENHQPRHRDSLQLT